MKLTIFGASGGVGCELVSQAMSLGHEVRAVVRSGTKVAFDARVERLHIDDLTNSESVAAATRGADAVLSAVGLRRSNPNNPWSKFVSPVDLTSRFARTLVEVLTRETPAVRLIAVSAAGVGDSRPHMSGVLRWLFDHSNVGVAYADLAKMEAVLAGSSLDWMAVRPVTLANGAKSGRVKVVEQYGLMAKIRRSDVAAWMLDQLAVPSTASRTPMIEHG